jgi:polyisoprenoid-binding protein YceI
VLVFLGALLAAGPAAGAGDGEPSSFVIDPARSEIRFVLEATKHGVVGRTREIAGSAVLRPGTFQGVEAGVARVAAASLDAGNFIINRQMRSRLEAGKHPEIRFQARRFVKAPPGDPGAALRGVLRGDLTIRGITRPVRIELEGRWETGELHAEGSTGFKLTDFGIDPPRFLRFFRVRDPVRVEFEVTAMPAPGSAP